MTQFLRALYGMDTLGENETESKLGYPDKDSLSLVPHRSYDDMDFRGKDIVERESRMSIDSAEAVQSPEGTKCRTFTKEFNIYEKSFEIKTNQSMQECSKDKWCKVNDELETSANSETHSDISSDKEGKECADMPKHVKNESKLTDNTVKTDNTTERGTSVQGQTTETKGQDIATFLTYKRPKRRRSNQINYDESKVWDSEFVFDMESSGNVQPKKCKKSKTSTETLQKMRIIQSDSHFVEIFKNLYKLQKTGEYCDLQICAFDGHVFVHSVVIIAASPYLHKKLKQKLKKENEVKDLVFHSVPLWAIEKVVTYLYTGLLEILETDVKELRKHCKELGLNELYNKLCCKPSPADTEKAESVSTGNSVKPIKLSIKTKNIAALETGANNVKGASRKRKLEPDMGIRIKMKLPKQSVTLKKESSKSKLSRFRKYSNAEKLIKDDNVVNKSEIVENTSEVVDNARTKDTEDSAPYSSDIDSEVKVDNVADDFLKAGCDYSGDDTDSYFENDSLGNGIKYNGNTKKKKKNHLSRKKDRRQRKDKSKTELNINRLGLFNAENTVEANDKIVLDKQLLLENKVSEENKEKNSVVIEAGNGGECDKCGKSFYFQYELTAHRKKCTGKNNRQRRKCVSCRQCFDSTEDYTNHRNNDEQCIALRQEKLVIRKQRKFEMRRKFCCCACQRKFRRLADQIEHEYLAHEIQYDKEKWPDLYCEYCNYWSMNPWKLHHHKLVSCNKGQEPICDMCGNSYKNEKTLKKHKELMHTDVQPMLTCEECGKTLKGKKGLKHHIRLRHKGENLHNLMMCHICSQTYRTTSDLTFHLYRVHQQPLPDGFTVYSCDKCDYCHNNKRFYEKHMFLHEDKREWFCEICSKAFKTKNSLNTHMIVHTSNRLPCPFDDCSYKALKNCHLKNHIENQHTQKGEKHEKCHLCDYATFFRGNLIKHQRSVHKLEVVTRHSVEMKAKYKNLKSGQILGVDKNECSVGVEKYECAVGVEKNECAVGVEKNECSVGVERNEIAEEKSGLPQSMEVDQHVTSIEMEPARDLLYQTCSSSTENSVVENPHHFQDKSVAMQPSQNVTDSFMYSLVSTPVMSLQSNFPGNTTMYRIPNIDFTLYNQNSSMDQI